MLVYRYPHRIVFSNPGVMLISKQQFYQGGESVCRNTSLQQMFMMIGSAEKAGSGVDKILKGWETLNWKRPYPIEKSQPNKVELIMPLESLLDNRVLIRLDQIFGNRIDGINSNERMALSMALTEGVINNERLRDVLPLHRADITRMLQRLCKDGLLDSSGHGRGTIYQLKVTTSSAKVTTSSAKVTTSDTKVATSEVKVTTSIPSRLSKEDMRRRIIDFCSDWRTVNEIAIHMGRTKQYIRIKVLPQMSDVLQKLFDKENHPGQKYKIKD